MSKNVVKLQSQSPNKDLFTLNIIKDKNPKKLFLKFKANSSDKFINSINNKESIIVKSNKPMFSRIKNI